jgi:hypothetical protein
MVQNAEYPLLTFVSLAVLPSRRRLKVAVNALLGSSYDRLTDDPKNLSQASQF